MVKEDSYAEFVCGWGAAFVNLTITFPINKVMFRQQLQGVRSHKAISQLYKEGWQNIYRGLLPPLLQKTTSMTLMFGTYYKVRNCLNDSPSFGEYWVINRTVAATLAGMFEASLCPFERIQVLLQDRNYNGRFSNTIHAAKDVYKMYGSLEFYRGCTPVLIRNCGSNIMFFLVRDYVMEVLPTPETVSERTLQDFICGAMLGAFLSTVFYPVNVIKVRMQSKLGGKEGILNCAELIWKERDKNIRKVFRGVHINFTRSFLSWGIVNATFEFLMMHLFNRSSRTHDK